MVEKNSNWYEHLQRFTQNSQGSVVHCHYVAHHNCPLPCHRRHNRSSPLSPPLIRSCSYVTPSTPIADPLKTLYLASPELCANHQNSWPPLENTTTDHQNNCSPPENMVTIVINHPSLQNIATENLSFPLPSEYSRWKIEFGFDSPLIWYKKVKEWRWIFRVLLIF